MEQTIKLNKLALISGADIHFEGIKLHVPTIKEFAEQDLDEQDIFHLLDILLISKEKLGNTVPQTIEGFEVNNYLLFTTLVSNEVFIEQDGKKFNYFLELLFKNYTVSFSQIGIILSDIGETSFYIINDSNFEKFQKYLKEIFCLDKIFSNSEEEYNISENDKKAKELAEKFKKRHQILNDIKKKENGGDGSVIGSYISILSVALGMPLETLINKTIYQIFYLLDRYTLYYASDLDIKIKLAGGSSDGEQPDNWMKIT